jgi:uncharacterized protein YfkK (UPF0435 family)
MSIKILSIVAGIFLTTKGYASLIDEESIIPTIKERKMVLAKAGLIDVVSQKEPQLTESSNTDTSLSLPRLPLESKNEIQENVDIPKNQADNKLTLSPGLNNLSENTSPKTARSNNFFKLVRKKSLGALEKVRGRIKSVKEKVEETLTNIVPPRQNSKGSNISSPPSSPRSEGPLRNKEDLKAKDHLTMDEIKAQNSNIILVPSSPVSKKLAKKEGAGRNRSQSSIPKKLKNIEISTPNMRSSLVIITNPEGHLQQLLLQSEKLRCLCQGILKPETYNQKDNDIQERLTYVVKPLLEDLIKANDKVIDSVNKLKDIEDLKKREAIHREIATTFQLTVNGAERNIPASVEWALKPNDKQHLLFESLFQQEKVRAKQQEKLEEEDKHHQADLIDKHRLINFQVNELAAQRYLKFCQAKSDLRIVDNNKLKVVEFYLQEYFDFVNSAYTRLQTHYGSIQDFNCEHTKFLIEFKTIYQDIDECLKWAAGQDSKNKITFNLKLMDITRE